MVSMARNIAKRPIHVEGTYDNIFAALGRADAEDLLAKAELARALRRIVRERGLTQAGAAEILHVGQPEVSDVVRGRLAGFSLERLSRLLTGLGQDVRIVVQPKPASRKTATVRALVRRVRGAV